MATTFMFISCSKGLLEKTNENVSTSNFIETQNISIGKKLKNPYSVTNMKEALKLVKASNKSFIISEKDIKPTHLYIKFLPASWTEYEKLLDFDTLYVYDYPLDVERNGEGMSNDNVRTQMPNPLYSSVPVNLDIETLNVKYEKLEDLFIPDDFVSHNSISILGRNIDKESIIQLVNASMKLTGNLNDTLKSDNNIAARYVPSGRIRVWDTRMAETFTIGGINPYVPVRGVRVEARRWFTTHHGYTDNNGYYSVDGSFNNPCNYSLLFENGDFEVRKGSMLRAIVDGPKQSSPWNYDIQDNLIRFIAHVYRGAHRYWRENIGGLLRPTMPPSLKMIYGAYNENGTPMNLGTTPPPGMPNIKMFSQTGGVVLPSDAVFSSTVHETAHWTHFMNVAPRSIQDQFLRESWAVGLEWHITTMEYREKSIWGYGDPLYDVISAMYPIRQSYQYWRSAIEPNYTSIFIDLVDDYNQLGVTYGSWTSNIDDQVTGYTFLQLENDVVKYADNRSTLIYQLKQNKPIGVTDGQIDTLFTHF